MNEEDSKNEEKLEFTPEGETFGYISLDQARVRAIEHARDNREYYGPRYSRMELVWEVVSQEESEDYYDIRLSFRPAAGFSGKPGVEQFTIDKTGPITLRQILSQPRSDTPKKAIFAGLGLAVVVVAVVGGLAGTGVFSSSGTGVIVDPIAPMILAIAPDAPAQLVSPQGDVTIDVDVGSVRVPTQLAYQHLTIADIPPLPTSFSATGTIFDLTTSAPLLRPITITARFSSADATLAGSDVANVVIQHFKDATWTPLLTDVDFGASTAKAQVASLSLFALTIRGQRSIPAPALTPTPTAAIPPSITPRPSPTPTAIPAAAATPILTTTATPAPMPTPVPVSTPSALATAIPVPTPVPVPTLTPTPVAQYLLETAISPEGWGSVEAIPKSDDGRYPSGTVVAVTARCNLGFVSWAGDVPEGVSPYNNSVTVSMHRDIVLVALCAGPTPTPVPIPTPTPSPTATPQPRYTLSINGFDIGAGQSSFAVGNGTIVLSQPPDADGTFAWNTELTLLADTGGLGARVFWTSVDSKSGNQATVLMAGPRSISVVIIPSRQPTPTPTPLPQLEVPGTVFPTATPVPTPTPTPAPTATLAPGVTPTITPTPAPTATPTPVPASGRIAFYSSADGNDEIYMINADGSGQTRLTNDPLADRYPDWSPDGSKIAWWRDGQIWVMNADGSAQTNLTNSGGVRPSWSPDGAKIVFESDSEIYVMNADGSAQTRLTNNSAYDGRPSWSPDGAKITFESHRDGNEEIYVMNADGSAQTRLTNNSSNDEFPSWAPGSSIIFQSSRDGNWEIYSMNADGTGQTNLTNHPFGDSEPSWSPDGTKIAFESARDGGNVEIYVMNADGSGQTRVTNTGATERGPDWGP